MSVSKWQGYSAEVSKRLQSGGYSADSAAALLDFDAEMFRLMRSIVKGELPAQLMSEMGQGLDLAQFQALTAIMRLQGGIGGRDPQEATVGLVAAELNVDPSRASRIVSDLIGAGLLRRDVSQSDGRKSILNLTHSATALLLAFRDLKWAKTMQVFANWTEAEICSFSQLFLRYNEGMRAAYPSRD
ncbi:MarR family winged helix-turn-helix transcriptional regulator [Cypionkella sp.]|jgi:DNA-binding MarR family transcriptional regulator|uniref:MarR family winged helix-turn-helix transcriptional regulator n=1 Tax=Cypionkella sp. TaxID=2811411 RepID=UPI00275DB0E6|nr:MarR family transcriptional regulator [Cypionkella sp.]